MTGGASESDDMKAGVRAGRFQLIFFTPELLIDNKSWRKLLSPKGS